MKVSKLFILKEKLLADKRAFSQQDYSKKIEYDATKANILERIDKIEQSRIQEERFLRDIDKHLGRMEKRLNIKFDLEPELPSGSPEKSATASSVGLESDIVPPA